MVEGDDGTESPATAVERPLASRAPTPSPLTRGTLVGRYLVLDEQGAGGMGVVYRAYDPELDRRVALKVMQPRAGESVGGHSRMLREAQALARLAHPNVVAVYDVGSVGERVFIAMELVEGETLSSWLRGRKRGWREIVAVFAAAGHGLAAAHAAGIIHRDFKPGNVLVGKDGRARVLDFGLARATDNTPRPADPLEYVSSRSPLDEELTATGSVLGTPVYMPPEALRGEQVGEAGDQFSFCVALFEALYGVRPFDPRAPGTPFGPVRAVPADSSVPAWVRRIALRGLAEQPRDRFASIDELLAALGDDPAIRRRRRIAIAGAVIAVAAMVGTGWWWQRRVRAERLADDPCADPAPLAGTWDDAARERLHATYRVVGGPKLEPAFTRAADAMDHAAAALVDARARACSETREQHIQPEAVLVARLACLAHQRDQLVDVLELYTSAADPEMLGVLDRGVRRVPGPAVCANARSLTTEATPPLALVPAVAALHKRLAIASALEHAAKYDRQIAVLEPLLGDARRLGYAPMIAAVLSAMCIAYNNLQEVKRTANVCSEAERVAMAAHMDSEAASAATARAQLGALVGRDAETVKDWIDRAQAWVDRVGDVSSAYSLEVARAIGAATADEGIPHYQRAEELGVAIYGEDSDVVFSNRSNLALVLALAGRYDEAIALQQKCIARMARLYGDDSSTLAQLYDNYGFNLSLVGRYAEAREALRSSLRAYGSDDPWRGAPMCDLARVDLAEGNAVSATTECEQGLALLRGLGLQKFNLAINMDPLAAAYLGAMRFDRALETARVCIAEFRKDQDKDVIEAAPCLVYEGTALVELGKPTDAARELERALRVMTGHVAAPGALANARFQLARALVASHGERARASELVAAALDELGRYPFLKAKRAAVEAWRASSLGPR
jgi:tetratricopeptide (TPR) repeat protein